MEFRFEKNGYTYTINEDYYEAVQTSGKNLSFGFGPVKVSWDHVTDFEKGDGGSWELSFDNRKYTVMLVKANSPENKEILDFISSKVAENSAIAKKYLSNYSIPQNEPFRKIADDIVNKIAKNEIILNSDPDDLRYFWQSMCFKKKLIYPGLDQKKVRNEALEFLDEVKKKSIILCAEFAIQSGLKNFGVTKVSHSNTPNINVGEYFYDFNETGDLRLLSLPLVGYLLKTDVGDVGSVKSVYYNLTLFDNRIKIGDNLIHISQKMIYDFDLEGSLLAMTNSTHEGNVSPLNTMFKEFLFGQSYSIISGLSSNMPKVESKIEDVRTIQLILNDKSDIRFEGISIYYDMKRFLGNVKNKKEYNQIDPDLSDFNKVESSSEKSSINFDQLKQLKELLDLGIVTQEEFDKKKRDLLGL